MNLDQILSGHGMIGKGLSAKQKKELVDAVNAQLDETSEMLVPTESNLQEIITVIGQLPNQGEWNDAKQGLADALNEKGLTVSESDTFGSMINQIAAAEFRGVWVVDANMLSIRNGGSGLGTFDSALALGGRPTAGSPAATTEKYNGSSWASDAALIGTREHQASTGDTGAGILCAGYLNGSLSTSTELYNGTSWAAGVSFTGGSIYYHEMVGVQADALAVGGYNGSAGVYGFNGSTWASKPNMTQGSHDHAASGIANNAIVSGGYYNGIIGRAISFNGLAWSSIGVLNIARDKLCGAGSADSIIVGGQPSFGGGFAKISERYHDGVWNCEQSVDIETNRSTLSGNDNNYLLYMISDNVGTRRKMPAIAV